MTTRWIEALSAGRLAAPRSTSQSGAARSVEPYWDLPNVIITPHTSGAMQDY